MNYDDLIKAQKEPEKAPELNLNIKLTYPRSDEFDFFAQPEIIDLDVECKKDIESGNGFLIDSPKATNKKDIKNPNGIYSPKFGQKLGDSNPFVDRYSCECGELKGRIYHNIECTSCHTKCKYVDDDFKIFGWIVLNEPYHILHPKFYDSLDFIFGASPYNEERKKIKSTKLLNIINFSPEVDQHGQVSPCQFKPDNEPYYGIGMIEFYEKFDEILDYYMKKNPKKQEYLEEITENRYACDCRLIRGKHNLGCTCTSCGTKVKFIDKDIIFTHSIPVFTTQLRPMNITEGYMYYEPTNAIYNIINKHVHSINNDSRKMNKDIIIKNSELAQTQIRYMELVNEIFNILSGKKGQLRMLIGGRYNFSSRAVIRQSGELRIDQVKLPYVMLVKCLRQQIINILLRTYNFSPTQAHDIWAKAVATKDERVAEIISNIIKMSPEGGIPVIINRNPTIRNPLSM